MNGKLKVVYGTMNSFKSALAVATYQNLSANSYEVITFRHYLDTREPLGVIHSRAGIEISCLTYNKNDMESIIRNTIKKTEKSKIAIIFDEIQFMTIEEVIHTLRLIDKYGIFMIAYGLRTNYLGEPFIGMSYILSLADEIQEVKSSCSCGNKATMHVLKNINGDIIEDGSGILIGDKEYKQVCRSCWLKLTNWKNNNISSKE